MEIEVSVLYPVRSNTRHIGRRIVSIAKQLESVAYEVLVVNAGSCDGSVPEAVRVMKEQHIYGAVLQNGDESVCEALKTGLSRASGRYVTFLSSAEPCAAHLKTFLETAKRMEADFVFGCENEEEARTAERRSMSRVVAGQERAAFLAEWLKSGVRTNFYALLFETEFARKIQSYFMEEPCCAEAFLFHCLIESRRVAQAPYVIPPSEPAPQPAGDAFAAVEAMLGVRDKMKASAGLDKTRIHLMDRQKLPLTILKCADAAILSGVPVLTAREKLRVLGYDRYLITGLFSDSRLRRRVFLFRWLPQLYKPDASYDA